MSSVSGARKDTLLAAGNSGRFAVLDILVTGGSGELTKQDFMLCATLYGTTRVEDSEEDDTVLEVLDSVDAELGDLSSGWDGEVGVSGSTPATMVLSESLEVGAFEGAGSVLLNVFRTVGDIAERVSNRSPEHPTLPFPKVFGTA